MQSSWKLFPVIILTGAALLAACGDDDPSGPAALVAPTSIEASAASKPARRSSSAL